MSVLYQPFDEMDLTQDYAAPPLQSYFGDILDQRQTVEDYAAAHSGDVVIAHSARELEEHLTDARQPDPGSTRSRAAFTSATIPARCTATSRSWRGPSGLHHRGPPVLPTGRDSMRRRSPFLPDGLYNRVFHQDKEVRG